MVNLKALLDPKSVAVIGASNNPEKVGCQIMQNLLEAEYDGAIFPVNLKQEVILGLPSLASVKDIVPDVDLAIVAIPAPFVKDVVAECIEKKVRSLIIITAGFAEVGEEGKKNQDEIKKMCDQADVTLLGPNCFGAINTAAHLNATFAKSMPTSGPVSFFSQSGAIISSVIDWSKTANLGFGKIISLGNKASLKEAAILEYLYQDDDTKVILGYLESLKVDDELTRILVKNAKSKPTVMIFGGKSDFGVQAAKSHTGSIVSSYISIKTYLEEAGVILVDTLDEFLTVTRIFAKYQTIAGNNMAIITNAGGPGILASDALHYHGLNLAQLTDKTVDKLRKTFRPESNLSNPIDILGDASDKDYQQAIEIISADPNVDGIAVILTPQSSTKIEETTKEIIRYVGTTPLVSSFIGGDSLTKAKNVMRKNHIPCFNYPEEAINALAMLVKFSKEKPELRIEKKKEKKEFLEDNKVEILKNWGFPVLEYRLVENEDTLKSAANEIGYPVVLKTADPEINHKTEADAVKLNILNEESAKTALQELGGRALIGKMIVADHELFLGIKKDPKVGTIVAFGTGGIYAEIYSDFSYRIGPVRFEVAMNMIEETKMGQILAGARGKRSADLDLLAWLIVKASWLPEDFSNIKEIDFNPVLVDSSGFHIVDVRIII